MSRRIMPDTETGIVASHERRLNKPRPSSGFDPNADPVVIGNGADGHTTASSVTIGQNGDVSADFAVQVGAAGDVSGASGVGVGFAVTVSAQSGTATGEQAFVSAQYGSAYGSGAGVAHDFSTAIGQGATSSRAHQIMLGSLNNTTGVGNEIVEIPGKGNGIAVTAPNGTRYVMTVSNAGATVWTATP